MCIVIEEVITVVCPALAQSPERTERAADVHALLRSPQLPLASIFSCFFLQMNHFFEMDWVFPIKSTNTQQAPEVQAYSAFVGWVSQKQ